MWVAAWNRFRTFNTESISEGDVNLVKVTYYSEPICPVSNMISTLFLNVICDIIFDLTIKKHA